MIAYVLFARFTPGKRNADSKAVWVFVGYMEPFASSQYCFKFAMHRQHKEEDSDSPSEGCQSTSRGRLWGREGYLVRLVGSFDEVFKMKEWMVPIGQGNTRIGTSKLIGQTFIISGPAQSGKASLVYWALRNDDETTAVVTVDCSLYRTELQFIQKLTKDLGEKIGVSGLDRRVVASENIKFADLNAPILQQGRPVVILIRNAERLVEARKQILLYNLLEWMLTEVKTMVGLVFTTRLMFFVDRFQKRVRSRLAAKQVIMQRPTPQNMRLLLLRRIECLLQDEKQAREEEGISFYQKIIRCIYDNKEFVEIIRDNQEFSQRDIVFYLNAMKITCSTLGTFEEIISMPDKDLKELICQKFKESFDYIFPFIPQNLLKSKFVIHSACTYPEYMVMAIIYYMAVNERTPFRFKTVYEIYLQFRQKMLTQEGAGSAFAYSKAMLQRAVLRLEEIRLIELDSRDESLWNCEIRCFLYPEDLRRAMDEINEKERLPYFIQEILNC